MRAVVLHGSYTLRHVVALESRGIKVYQDRLLPSLESEQIDVANEIKEALDLYVITPDQTGFNAVAELTAQAIQSPDSTAMLIDKDGKLTPDQEVDTHVLGTHISGHGGKVFNDINEASDYVQTMK